MEAGRGERKGLQQRDLKKLLEYQPCSCLDYGDDFMCVHTSKISKLYTLNIVQFLYINHTSKYMQFFAVNSTTHKKASALQIKHKKNKTTGNPSGQR